MKVYNQEKTEVLEDYDLTKGRLIQDKLFIAHHDAEEEVQARSVKDIADNIVENGGEIITVGDITYKVSVVYPNGGKDVEEIAPIEYKPAKEAWDEYEDVLVYTPFTEEELREHKIQELRYRRQSECFSVINRGQLWYDKLTAEQRTELSVWYEAWLDAPQTMVAPELLPWLNSVAKQK